MAMNEKPGSNGFNSAGSPSEIPDGQTDQPQPVPQASEPDPEYPVGGYVLPQQHGPQGPWAPNSSYTQTWTGPPHPGPSQQPKKNKRIKLIAGLAVALVILLLGVGTWLIVSASRTDFEAIGNKCENEYSLGVLLTVSGFKEVAINWDEAGEETWDVIPSFVTVNRDASSITVHDRNSMSIDKIDYLSGLTGSARDRAEESVDLWNAARDLSIISAVNCIHDELSIPDSVNTRMLSTRGMDGVQEVTHNGFRATWSYHPSSGLNAIYEKE